MNRTIKEATVKRYHYETHDQLKEHLAQFLAAYNFAERLKMLRGLTPYEYIGKCWQKEPERFRLNPHHHSMGLNRLSVEGSDGMKQAPPTTSELEAPASYHQNMCP